MRMLALLTLACMATAARKSAGEACTAHSDCQAELYCADTSVAEKKCAAALKDGEICTRHGNCDSWNCGLAPGVVDIANKTCLPDLKQGDVCTDDKQCWIRNGGGYCKKTTGQSVGTCVKGKGWGEPCARDAECGTDNYFCKDKECAPKYGEQEPCTRDDECMTWYCKPGAGCTSQKVQFDQPCTRDAECDKYFHKEDDEWYDYTASYCTDVITRRQCATKLANDDDCASGEECRSDNCTTDGICAAKAAGTPATNDDGTDQGLIVAAAMVMLIIVGGGVWFYICTGARNTGA